MMVFGTIVLPSIFVYLFDNHPLSFPILLFISFFLVFSDFFWGKDWDEYNKD